MDESALKLESLKLLQDWSKWLIGLEAGICALLWPKLTGEIKPAYPVYLGWLMFWGSIIAAAILLITISITVRRMATSGERNMNKVWILVAIEYAFFLGGVCFFAWHIVEVWLSSI